MRLKIEVENPNLRQRVIVITANWLLWLLSKMHPPESEFVKEEAKDIIIDAYKAIREC